MLILAMDFNDVAFWYLYGEGETVTGESYRDFIDREITSWLQGTDFRSPILLHGNTRPHKSGLVRDFLRARQYEPWDHLPYSSDLNPCDFNCFNPLKHQLKGTRYTDRDKLREALEAAIREGSERGLYKGIQMLPERWETVINNDGAYL
jgi:[histone H3]-lysine36 N-dimethyltransferase SETMAR